MQLGVLAGDQESLQEPGHHRHSPAALFCRDLAVRGRRSWAQPRPAHPCHPERDPASQGFTCEHPDGLVFSKPHPSLRGLKPMLSSCPRPAPPPRGRRSPSRGGGWEGGGTGPLALQVGPLQPLPSRVPHSSLLSQGSGSRSSPGNTQVHRGVKRHHNSRALIMRRAAPQVP